jgi:hypothetical protein
MLFNRFTQHYDAQFTLLHVVEYFPEDRSNVQIAPEDVDPEAYREERARASLAAIVRTLLFNVSWSENR